MAAAQKAYVYICMCMDVSVCGSACVGVSVYFRIFYFISSHSFEILRFSDYLHVSRFYVAFIGFVIVVAVAFLCSGNMQFALKRVTL